MVKQNKSEPNPIDNLTKTLFNKLFYQPKNTNELKILIEKALDQGFDINVQDEYGYTLLYTAIYRNGFGIAEFLIEKGADTNIANTQGTTPLHNIIKDMHASLKENIYITKLLLQKGAIIDSKDFSGATPIQWAVREKKIELTELLIDYGANLNITAHMGFYEGKSLIKVAAELGNKKLQTLLKLAMACQNNDFKLIDDSVTKEDIEKFTNHKISIKPQIKLFPKYLTELNCLKNFLATKKEFVEDGTVERLEDVIDSKFRLKYLLLPKIIKEPHLYKFDILPLDLIEELQDNGLKLAGESN